MGLLLANNLIEDLCLHQIHLVLHYSQTIASPPSAGADYDPISTLVGFSGGAGALSLSQPPIQIAIINDAVPESTETFGLTGVINVGGALAQFVDNTATVQIFDNDGMTHPPYDMFFSSLFCYRLYS